MKKIICFLLACILSVGGIFCTHSAVIGDAIGEIVYTDICAYINNYDIPSYNMNGYTMIVVEDLRYYGFDVVWDAARRRLDVTRNDKRAVNDVYDENEVDDSLIGKKAGVVLYTDITTYFDGKKVESYNIDGKTVVNFNELWKYGEVIFVNETRRLDLYIDDHLNYAERKFPTRACYPGTRVPKYDYIIKDAVISEKTFENGYMEVDSGRIYAYKAEGLSEMGDIENVDSTVYTKWLYRCGATCKSIDTTEFLGYFGIESLFVLSGIGIDVIWCPEIKECFVVIVE